MLFIRDIFLFFSKSQANTYITFQIAFYDYSLSSDTNKHLSIFSIEDIKTYITLGQNGDL